MKTKPHDLAFPAFNSEGYCDRGGEGLTKRELFAAMAMEGNLSSLAPGFIDTNPSYLKHAAAGWVAAADALIATLNAAREKG